MKKNTMVLFCLLIVTWVGFASGAMSYLDNGHVKIGVDTGRSATITYFSQYGSSRNVINYADWGREVQQSYYSGPTPFDGGYYNSQPWPWNPVEAGDTNNHASTVLTLTNDGSTIYTKVIPKQWALNNVDSECTMEKWITLSGNVAHVQCKLVCTRTDTTDQYVGRHQELPAVYATADLYRIFTYNGWYPFTNAATTQMTASFPWTYTDATENWIACVDNTNWGLGIFTPNAQQAVLGFYGTYDTSPPGNPTSSSTAYMSPLRTEIIDYNITYEYDFYLILDTLSNIRSYAYAHQPNQLPNYVFDTSRKGWYYKDGLVDSGFPINGYLHVLTTSSDPYMIGPETVWQAGNVPKIYIRARYNATNTSAKIYWESFSSLGWVESRSKSFTIINDNQWHIYEVNLASDSDYTGAIRKLRFDPVSTGYSGDYVDIASITSYNPTQAPVINVVTPNPDTSAYAGIQYTKQLQASSGDTPITWSLLQAPTGMQINSNTGYVSGWIPKGCDADASTTVQVQAQNSSGSDATTWQIIPQPYYMTDNIANISDLLDMVSEWLEGGSNLITDLNCSGEVDLGDFANLAGIWLVDQTPELIISNLNPTDYEIQYNEFSVGDLVYIDRSYTFPNVASLGGSTYIKTANDDKYSTAATFLTFDINRDCTVYVAHDDRVADPTWLSSFTDTTENLTIDGATHSLLEKDFSAGTVSLGGNGDPTGIGSMYTVIIVPQ